MCLICVQLQQNKLTAKEARRNFFEMIAEIPQSHHETVAKIIEQKRIEEDRREYKYDYEPHSED